MSVLALTCFITGAVAGATGLFVFLKERGQILNRLWCFFNLAIAIWMIGLGGTLIVNNQNNALFCQRILYIGTILIPILFFQFCLVLVGKENEKRFIALFRINSFLGIIFIVSLFTSGLFIKEVKARTNFGYWPVEVGWFYYPFLVWFAFNVIYAFLLLRRNLKNKEIEILKHKQISIIYYGTLIGFSAGSINFLLDFNITFPPFHNLFVISYLFFTALAVVRYRLFNLRIILTEALVVATALALLIQATIAETILLKILGGALFVLFTIFGYQLVKSVIKEIELRAELEKAYVELEKIDKAKTEFLAVASHQLRTPLTSVKGYISMALEGDYGEIPEKAREKLSNVYVSNERLVKLVNELLNITHIEMGKMDLRFEKGSLEDIISSAIGELKIKADEKNLYLKYEAPTLRQAQAKIPLPEISMDKDKIRQVILNLVDNAIKYTQEGGVTVKCQMLNVPAAEQARYGAGKCQIIVADTGEGMEKEEIETLFDVFVRGAAGKKSWVEGSGLGLYIARKFVEMHGGRVWAESGGKGKGSTFYVELPVTRE